MIRILPLAALLASVALPAAADHLDPRVAGPLQAMFQSAVQQCQAGYGASCNAAQAIRQREMQLSQAQHACQQGNQQACQYFQQGAQQVLGAYQQQQQAGMLGGGVPQGGGGQGYSTQQMTQDHMARMQQQQGQFQQHQGQMRQQQNQFDEQNRRFLEQLRR
jgi:hypothetical protein